MADRKETVADEVPRDLTTQAVTDLRVVFATYQESDKEHISIAHVADIVELLGDPRPDSAILGAMLGKGAAGDDAPPRSVDFKGFLRFFVYHLYGGNLSVRSRDIFRALDSDDSQYVSAEELQEQLASMGMSLNADEALAMTSVADSSKEGEVSYHDFKQICRRVDSDLMLCAPTTRGPMGARGKFAFSPFNAGTSATNPFAKTPRSPKFSKITSPISTLSQE